MKNLLSSTCGLVLLVIGGLVTLSFLSHLPMGGQPLCKIDSCIDVRPEIVVKTKTLLKSDSVVLLPPVKPHDIDTCRNEVICIEDYSDSTERGMQAFYESLLHINKLNRPVRIAYFGDSFIEADIFTGDLRARLQERFGGCGVEYIPITSRFDGYRPTVRHRFDGWSSHTCTDTIEFRKDLQDISCSYYFPRSGAFIELKGQKNTHHTWIPVTRQDSITEAKEQGKSIQPLLFTYFLISLFASG